MEFIEKRKNEMEQKKYTCVLMHLKIATWDENRVVLIDWKLIQNWKMETIFPW